MPNLAGKIALVTGSTDGVGRLVARSLAESGAHVFVHGRNSARGQEVVAEIEAGGGRAQFIQADLSDLAEVRGLAETVVRSAERLDLLINNAGIGSGGPGAVRRTNAAGHEMRFAVNYLAGFLLTRRLLPLVVAARGRVVNVAEQRRQLDERAAALLRAR